MKWQLTLEQHNDLAKILLRARPRPEKEDVKLFLDNTGRIINCWLSSSRVGAPKQNSASLDDVAAQANRLVIALGNLDGNSRYALSLELTRMHGLMPECESDFHLAREALERYEAAVREILEAAVTAHDPYDGDLKKRRQRDLLIQLAREYASKLGCRPSDNRRGAFGLFAQELAKNILPDDEKVSFGHELLKSAVAAVYPIVVDPRNC